MVEIDIWKTKDFKDGELEYELHVKFTIYTPKTKIEEVKRAIAKAIEQYAI